MAKRGDQQRRTPTAVRIGRAPDVPSEPAVGLVAEQLGQDRAAASRAELDATDPVSISAPVCGRADGDVIDAVSVQVARGDDHPSEELTRLAPGPVPELLSGGPGVDAKLARKRPLLV